MNNLSLNAQKLFRHLVSLTTNINPKDPSTFTGYREVHQALGWGMVGRTWGESLSRQGLDELAAWLLEHGAPALTGIVVDKSSYQPGEGYFVMYGNPPDRYAWWEAQMRQAQSFDWETMFTL
jgi:hypothetical protein